MQTKYQVFCNTRIQKLNKIKMKKVHVRTRLIL